MVFFRVVAAVGAGAFAAHFASVNGQADPSAVFLAVVLFLVALIPYD